jgi:O-antigen ligase
MAPLAAVQLFTGIPAAVMPKQRSFVRTSMIICGLGGLLVIGTLQSDRFADVGTVLVHGSELMKPPEAFTGDERRILSGRVYLWSNYIDAYENGTTVQKIIGRGPDSWSSNFAIYAHNTLVSYLYEMGIIGVAAILLLWATIASVAMRAQRGQRATILGAHASFFLLNMATMPHWQIEGNILYGLICGYTLASARAARLVTTSQRRVSATKYFTPIPDPETLPAPAR